MRSYSLNIILCIAAFFLLESSGFSQSAVLASGDDGSGAGGTLSCSVGLVSYTAVDNSTFFLEQGMQHAYSVCFGDYNHDGDINTSDLLILLAEYPCAANCTTDMNSDGIVDTQDLLEFLSLFGTSCS